MSALKKQVDKLPLYNYYQPKYLIRISKWKRLTHLRNLHWHLNLFAQVTKIYTPKMVLVFCGCSSQRAGRAYRTWWWGFTRFAATSARQICSFIVDSLCVGLLRRICKSKAILYDFTNNDSFSSTILNLAHRSKVIWLNVYMRSYVCKKI